MKSSYLLPYRFKCVGWIIFLPSLIMGLLFFIFNKELPIFDCKVLAISDLEAFGKHHFLTVIPNNIQDEIISILIIIGAFFISFSKEKSEDEYISKLRLESLIWATYINYFILVFSIIFLYEFSFYWILIFNMFTILIVFIIKFNWALWKFKKNTQNEE